jgi:lipoate-protein ligase A
VKLCDQSLGTPEADLACDEALLDLCEEGGEDEVLRFWAPEQTFVVVGYANSVAREVNVEFCEQNRIPILRRCTGGGTVLQGPGCLNYSLVLRIENTPALQGITSTNRFILARNQAAASALVGDAIVPRGHTDLAFGLLKFSGNAQRRRRKFLLFHGVFLLRMDLELIERALPMPSKQPDYRRHRSHRDFLVNIEADAAQLKTAIAAEWRATAPLSSFPADRIERLVSEKYSQRDWNFRF